MHFGSKADELLVFDKLDSRMAKIEQKRAQKEAGAAGSRPASPAPAT